MITKQSMLTKGLLIATTAIALAACGDNDHDNDKDKNISANHETSVQKSTISLMPTKLEPLGDSFDYEGWLITSKGPVSTGKFDINADDKSAEQKFEVNKKDADDATKFVLTIEPADETGADIKQPTNIHILGGDITNNTSILSTSHASALGTDFSEAAAKYILATPTNGNATPTQGIWYIDKSSGKPMAGLKLPTLPEGWQYEGWIVDNGMPLSTGTFTKVNEEDSNGAGIDAGDAGFPSFPGQDYVNPAKDLVGKTAVISVEPNPDNSVTPFSIKPLIGTITNEQGMMMLDNKSAESLPSATISIR